MAADPYKPLSSDEVLRLPYDICLSPHGDLFFTDGHRVLYYAHGKDIQVFCGAIQCGYAEGDRFEARFNQIRGLCLSPDGELFIADSGNHCIRRVRKDGKVELYAGGAGAHGHVNGARLDARFNSPRGLCLTLNGDLLVADYDNNVIRRILRDKDEVVHESGSGICALVEGGPLTAAFAHPHTLRMGPQGEILVATTVPKNSYANLPGIFPDRQVAFIRNNYSAAPIFDVYPNYSDGSLTYIFLERGDRGEKLIQVRKRPYLWQQPFATSEVTIRPIEQSSKVAQRIRDEIPPSLMGAGSTVDTESPGAGQPSTTPAPSSPASAAADATTAAAAPTNYSIDPSSGIFTPNEVTIYQLMDIMLSQESIRMLLGLIYPCLAPEMPPRPSQDTVVPYLLVEGSTPYHARTQLVKPFKSTKKVKDVIEKFDCHGYFSEPVTELVILGPDGELLDENDRIAAAMERYSDLRDVAFLPAIPLGSKAYDEDDSTSSSSSSSSPPSASNGSSPSKTQSSSSKKKKEKSRTEEDAGMAGLYCRVQDLRGKFYPRLPLIFRITRRSYHLNINCPSAAGEVRPITISGGFCHRKVALLIEEYFKIPIMEQHIHTEHSPDPPSCGATPYRRDDAFEMSVVAHLANPFVIYLSTTHCERSIPIMVTPFMQVQDFLPRAFALFSLSTEQTYRVMKRKPSAAQSSTSSSKNNSSTRDTHRSLYIEDSISSAGLNPGDNILIEPRVDKDGTVSVKTLTGKTIVLPGLDPKKDYVFDLFSGVHDKEGIPIDQQRGIFAGKSMERQKGLGEYGIRDQSTVHLVLRLRG